MLAPESTPTFLIVVELDDVAKFVDVLLSVNTSFTTYCSPELAFRWSTSESYNPLKVSLPFKSLLICLRIVAEMLAFIASSPRLLFSSLPKFVLVDAVCVR